MRAFLQHCFAFVLFLFVLHLERAVGLPFFSLALATLYLASLSVTARVIAQLFLTGIVGVVYILPFTLVFLLFGVLAMSLEWQEIAYAHRAKFFFAINVLVQLICAFFLKFLPTPLNMLLFGINSAALFFFLTFWFERRQKKHITRLWKR